VDYIVSNTSLLYDPLFFSSLYESLERERERERERVACIVNNHYSDDNKTKAI
jgi:hypothetical protein